MDFFDHLQKLQKNYSKLLEPVCRQWDLSRNELDVLLFLYNNPQYDRAADIVSRRGIAKSHVSVSVADLENRGYLRKRIDTADRRTVHLELTESALPAAHAGKIAQQAMGRLLIEGFSQQELALLHTLGEKILQNIEKMEEK